ncbi:hypothetical protein PHLGIDRAFT_148405 [Phlebiopsis gigantea 11061_1 CR5-6]|uniref:Cytochrome P450 n=1 Tax=Phlebiopsis gigantea (strain 11061_1 CR5-6) TaxID=745531 RepID=A0A0C3PI04_PHLG1|nr:hypothetical protein PHLGIDRAFT_148405 [Phlebiopsis gigantea 11061_1 CR5-6]
MSSLTPSLQFAISIVLYLAVGARRRILRLLPGLRGLPILGHIFDLPKSREWVTYQKWGRQHKWAASYVLASDMRTASDAKIHGPMLLRQCGGLAAASPHDRLYEEAFLNSMRA